jgi:uncharacterized protein
MFILLQLVKVHMSIQIRNVDAKRKIDMKGGTVLDGLPSVGLINAIASECLIRTTGTELYAVIDSSEFPPISIVNNSLPQFPTRLHVNERLKVAFFMSEFNTDEYIQKQLAKKILDWSVEKECGLIISAAGISNVEDDSGRTNYGEVDKDSQTIYAVASSQSAAKMATEKGFVLLKSGWIEGIPATLLNEGTIAGINVIVLLVNTNTDVPDFHASTLISSAVTKLIPGLTCDMDSLTVEAQSVENKMKQVRDGRSATMSIYK